MELQIKGHFIGLQQLKLFQRFVCSNKNQTAEIARPFPKWLRLNNVNYLKLKILKGYQEGMNTSVTSLPLLSRTVRAFISAICILQLRMSQESNMQMKIWVFFWVLLWF